MGSRVPPLHPWPLNLLLERVAWEWQNRREIFGLPARRFFRLAGDVDLSVEIAGKRIATPVGPAAGPHTQLAQNIVLGWLAGARFFELKTVQVLDELEIDRPCIDMATVGTNIEWSQELTLAQSLTEYAKAWLLLAVLRRWEPLQEALGDPGDHIFELSVGYDLTGIQSEAMTRMIAGMKAAGPVIDRLRDDIPGPFKHLCDVEVAGDLTAAATLSTFHGCPPEEIEGIARHLMTAHGLDVTIKLNPTLLGEDRVLEILHNRLGFTEIPLVAEAFAGDLQFEQGAAMIERLADHASGLGRRFGIKLTNTLVVGNHRRVLPGDQVYLSGTPLHVLAVDLLDRLAGRLGRRLQLGPDPGEISVAFSAGIDKNNLTAAVALGLVPVTVCSDLLRPGGYGRLGQGLRRLAEDLRSKELRDLSDLRRDAQQAARVAGRRDAVAALAADLATAEGARPYARQSQKPLREVESPLQMFDCVACSHCVSVCPNNAFFQVPTPENCKLEAKHQYLLWAELCNDCGNCTTFCPEQGSPQSVKPRLYLNEQAWAAHQGEGFLLKGGPGGKWEIEGPQPAHDQLAQLLAEPEGLPLPATALTGDS